MGQLLISPILDLAECNIYGVDVVESFSGPKMGVALIFYEYSSTNIYSRASTNFWSDDYMAIILLKSATSNVQSNW